MGASEYDLYLKSRLDLLVNAGATYYFNADPTALVQMASSDLTDDELVESWLDSLTEIEINGAVERFKDMSDSYQKSQYALLDTRSQKLLKANGYQLPHDHLNWWNPGDWGQYGSNFLRDKSKWRLAALLPVSVLAGTGWAASNLIKQGWQGIEKIERFSSRMTRTMIEEGKDKGKNGSWWDPRAFRQYWDNAEYQMASFTTTGREKAYDLLGDEDLFNIMLNSFRYQGVEEGTYEFFLEQNGGDEYAALTAQRDFLASGVTETPEWKQAIQELTDSSTSTFKYGMDNWESLVVRQIPSYGGGLRGRPDATMEDASKFWRMGHVGSGVGSALVGSVMFDPLMGLDIAMNTRHLGNVKAGVNSSDAARWAQVVDQHWRSAAGIRALDEAKRLAAAGEDWSAAGEVSKITNGMFVDAHKGISQNLKEWAVEAGDDWARRTSWGRRRNLREVNNEIDAITEAFIAHDKWKKDLINNAVTNTGLAPTNPLYSSLARRNPAYRDALPLMLNWHDNAIDTMYVDATGNNILVPSKGLSTYDGVWEFLRSASGNRALSRGLGAINTEKLMLPTFSWSARQRLRANDARNRILSAKDPFEEAAPGIWAESVAVWLSTRENYAIRRIRDQLKIKADLPLSNGAYGLSEYELGQLLNDPVLTLSKWQGSDYRHLRDVTSHDVTVLKELMEQERAEVVRTLHGAYREVMDGGTLDNVDLPDDLRAVLEDNWPSVSRFFTWHEDTFGVLRFDKNGRPAIPTPNEFTERWSKHARQFVDNRRRGMIHPPGSAEAQLLEKFPQEIVRIGAASWDELLQMGYDVGPFRTNLKLAGFDNPNELLKAIDEFSIKEVAGLAKMKPSELRWFLKHRIHTAVNEGKFYNAAGKLADAGWAALYTAVYHPVRTIERFSRHVPRHKYIDVNGMDINDAMPLKEFEAFVEMGVMANVPRKVMDNYISAFVHGSEAMRQTVIAEVMTDILGRGGFLLYGGDEAMQTFQKYVRAGETAYGNTGADQFLSRGRLTSRAITPSIAHQGMTSQANIIPDWRQMGEMTQYLGYMRHLGWKLGVAEMDMWINRWWRPAVLLKFGLGPRNAMDEMLIHFLNNGPAAYIDAKAASVAMNRTKIWDAYGNRIILSKDDVIGMAPVRSDDQMVVEATNAIQSRYETSANYSGTGRAARNLTLARGPLWAYRNLLDFMTVGRGPKSMDRARKLAASEWQSVWHRLSPAQQKEAVLLHAAQRNRGQRLGPTARRLLDFGESLSHNFAGKLHYLASRVPDPLSPEASKVAMRILSRNDAENYRAARLLAANQLAASSLLEGIFAPYRQYYDLTSAPYLHDMLHGGKDSLVAGVLDYLELDYSSSALGWRFRDSNTGLGVLNDKQAAAQYIGGYFQEEPALLLAAQALSNYVGPNTKNFFEQVLPKAPLSDEASEAEAATRSARYAYELVSKAKYRERLRTLWDQALSGTVTTSFRSPLFPKAETWEDAARSLVESAKDKDLAHLMHSVLLDRAIPVTARMDALAFLANRTADPALFTADSTEIFGRQIKAAMDELRTIDGRQRLMSLVRTDGIDPAIARTSMPTNENQIRFFFPHSDAGTSLSLAYMFGNPGVPVTDRMLEGLQEFLTFYLGSEDDAITVINNLNTLNNPHGSVLPAAWLHPYLREAPDGLSQFLVTDNTSSVSQAVQTFLANTTQPSVQKLKIPLPVGSHDPERVRKISQALRRWHKWLQTDIPTMNIRGILDRAQTAEEGAPVIAKILGRSEYEADLGFGRAFGSTSGTEFPRAGIAEPQQRPPTVFVAGDQWADATNLPSRWEASADADEVDEFYIRFMGQEESTAILSRREYVEEEIIQLARALGTLADQSRVKYFFSPSMRGRPGYESIRPGKAPAPSSQIAPGYDLFGARVERMIDLLNDHMDGTRTIGEIEEAIWRRFGDAPATAWDESRDFIGTVGEGPVGSSGFRRIFTEFDEDTVLPARSVIPEPVGDIAEYPKAGLASWYGDMMQTQSTDPRFGGVPNPEDVVARRFTQDEASAAGYMDQIETFSAEYGQGVSGAGADFRLWREEQLRDLVAGGAVDTAWPFYRTPNVADTAETILDPVTWDNLEDLEEHNRKVREQHRRRRERKKNPNAVPAWFQETNKMLEERGIPVDFDARLGSPSPVARLVRSKLALFPEAAERRTIWSWDTRLGRPVTPMHVGGFSGTDRNFIAVDPLSLWQDFEEIGDVAQIGLLNEWRHRATGDILWLRDGEELTLTSFRGLTSRMPDPSGSPPVATTTSRTVPERNQAALIDIGGAEIEHHKAVIDVPYEALDAEIKNAPVSPIDPDFRSPKGNPETPQINQLDVKRQVAVPDHVYESIVRGEQTAVALPATRKNSKGKQQQVLAGLSEGDIIKVHPRKPEGTAKPKKGDPPTKNKPILSKHWQEKIQGPKRKHVTPYPMRVVRVMSAAQPGIPKKEAIELFAELNRMSVDHVTENWGKGRNYQKFKVAILENPGSGWAPSHLSIDYPQSSKPLTRVMGEPGTSYYYTGKNFEAQPWTPIVADIKEQVEALTGYKFDLVIAQKYPQSRTTLGWHNDKVGTTNVPEEIVVSVNFGDTRGFAFRPRRETTGSEVLGEGTGRKYGYNEDRPMGPVVSLEHGDVLAMMAGANSNWEHSVLAGAEGGVGRINLTFRRVTDEFSEQVRFSGATPTEIHPSGLVRIISGGQNGADEAGLLAAHRLGIPTGGTATKGYKTTLGPKPEQAEKFGLVENQFTTYPPRTKANVHNSDGTVIFSQTPELSSGSKLTYDYAVETGKPVHIVGGTSAKAKEAFRAWLAENDIRVLNVAGSRQWQRHGVLRGKADFQDRVEEFLVDVLSGAPTRAADAPLAADLPLVAGRQIEPLIEDGPLVWIKELREDLNRFEDLEDWEIVFRDDVDRLITDVENGVISEREAFQKIATHEKSPVDPLAMAEKGNKGRWDNAYEYWMETPPETIHPGQGLLFGDDLDVPVAKGEATVDASPVVVFAGQHKNPILSNITEVPTFVFRGRQYRSPEGAYHAHKSGKYVHGFQKLAPWDAKREGRKLTDAMTKEQKQWRDENSIALMREIVQTRLVQDPAFKQALLATGNRKILHPSKDIWEREYPRLLEEARAQAQHSVDNLEPPPPPISAGRSASDEIENGEWELIGQQYLGPFDELNAAEQMARTGTREVNALLTDERRAARRAEAQADQETISGVMTDLPGKKNPGLRPNGHNAWILETADPIGGAVDTGRVVTHGDPDLMPERILAKAPIAPGNTGPIKGGTQKLMRSFFEGIVQPVITAMIREPLFQFNFMKGLEQTQGVAMTFQHRIEAFKGLARYLETPGFNGPRPILRRVTEANGREQWKLIDTFTEQLSPGVRKGKAVPESSFDSFIEDFYPVMSRAEMITHGDDAPLSRMSHLLAQWMDGQVDKSEILENVFFVKRREVSIADEVTGELYETVDWALGPFYQVFGPGVTGAPPGEGFEAFFEWMAEMHPKESLLMRRQIMEYLAGASTRNQAHVQAAMERAATLTAPFIDNHAVRTQFQETVGSAIPFHFAQMQFLQRWYRTLRHHPSSLDRLNVLLVASHNAGFVYEDKMGEKRLVVPGSEFFSRMLFETLAQIPGLRQVFGEDMGVLADAYSLVLERMMPGYDLDTIGNHSVGPLVSMPLNLIAMVEPSLAGDNWNEFGGMLVSSHGRIAEGQNPAEDLWSTRTVGNAIFYGVIPTPLIRTATVLMSGLLGQNTAALDRAMLSAAMILAHTGALPDSSQIADPSNRALVDQDTINSIKHVAKQLVIIQNATAFFGPTAAGPSLLNHPDVWEWNEKFQIRLDRGMSHEEAFVEMYDEYYAEFVEAQTAAGASPEEITVEWQKEVLKISAFSTGRTDKESIAATPQTVAAYEWLNANREWVNSFPLAGAFFIPRGLTEEDREWSVEARDLELAMGLRTMRTSDELIESIYVTAGAIGYFKQSKQHQQQIAAMRAARDRGERNPISHLSWAEEIARAERQWDIWKQQWMNTHPVFHNAMFGQESEQRRMWTLRQMEQILADPSSIPETDHRDDLIAAMDWIIQTDRALMRWSGVQSGEATRERNKIKAEALAVFEEEIKGKPWLNELYYNLFIPMLEEGWIIKYEAGAVDLGN